tara:strand:+ start:2909 stop:3172 length:264 start_codon:yes stop_codon:yes gene_type:complete
VEGKRWDLIRSYALSQNKEHLGLKFTVPIARRICPEGLIDTPIHRLEELIDELRKEWCRRVGLRIRPRARQEDNGPGPTPVLQTEIF